MRPAYETVSVPTSGGYFATSIGWNGIVELSPPGNFVEAVSLRTGLTFGAPMRVHVGVNGQRVPVRSGEVIPIATAAGVYASLTDQTGLGGELANFDSTAFINLGSLFFLLIFGE